MSLSSISSWTCWFSVGCLAALPTASSDSDPLCLSTLCNPYVVLVWDSDEWHRYVLMSFMGLSECHRHRPITVL